MAPIWTSPAAAAFPAAAFHGVDTQNVILRGDLLTIYHAANGGGVGGDNDGGRDIMRDNFVGIDLRDAGIGCGDLGHLRRTVDDLPAVMDLDKLIGKKPALGDGIVIAAELSQMWSSTFIKADMSCWLAFLVCA